MKKILLPERGAEILFDVQDENVRLLESLFAVRISARGPQILVEGEEKGVAALERLLGEFSELVSRGTHFSNGDLKEAFRHISEDPDLSLYDFFPRKVVLETPRREVVPRSPNQVRYVRAIQNSDLVLAIGPAGTGKTYLAVAMAVSYLVHHDVERIILARPAVEAGERLGFLPGDLQEKVNPYLRPLYDALFDMLGSDKVEKLLERRVIEIAPLAFMRGRTLNDCAVILDEAQNCTSRQMKMFLTRIGFRSKAVVTGDITQIDLPPGERSGLVEAAGLLEGLEGISICRFSRRDVVRHPLVRLIIQAYEEEEQ